MDNAAASRLLGERIVHLRRERDWTQTALAARAGLDRTYLNGVERGRRNVTLAAVIKIAVGLGQPISELMRYVDGALKPNRKPGRIGVAISLVNHVS